MPERSTGRSLAGCIQNRVNVHVIDPPDDEGLATLHGVDPTIAVTVGPKVPSSTHVLVGAWPSDDQLPEGLQALLIPFAGLPPTTRDRAIARGLKVYNQHHNAPLVAELVAALVLAVAKRVVPMDRQLRRGDWSARRQVQDVRTLSGSSALIIGFGAVGLCTARLLRGLGMQVTGIRRTGPTTVEGFEVREPERLDESLTDAAVVVLSMPATAETQGLFDAERLARLQDGAILINVARGGVIDEAALYAELRSGRISAGLDVWYRYPKRGNPEPQLPADLPFHELDNVVLSPHRGGLTADTERLRMEAVAVTLSALVNGEEPPHPVDLERGY